MKFHKEGYRIIAESFIINVGLAVIMLILPLPVFVKYILVLFFLSLIGWTLFFFRVPSRRTNEGEHILASADGEVVTIEEIFEPEYFKEKRLQISVFMSGLDVHVNWYPFSGTIKYTNYHEGKYLLARHPKSSEKNERSSIVLEKESGQDVLIRQVAGIMARRIVYYGKPGDKVVQGEELGIIRFGSRVDFFLPEGTQVDVNIGQKVRAQRTIIAHFSDK